MEDKKKDNCSLPVDSVEGDSAGQWIQKGQKEATKKNYGDFKKLENFF